MDTGDESPPQARQYLNAQERERNQRQSTAFDALRQLIPTDPHRRKLSKIDTIRMAMRYIDHLFAVLVTGEPDRPCSLKGHPADKRHKGARSICTFCIRNARQSPATE